MLVNGRDRQKWKSQPRCLEATRANVGRNSTSWAERSVAEGAAVGGMRRARLSSAAQLAEKLSGRTLIDITQRTQVRWPSEPKIDSQLLTKDKND